MVPNFVIRFRKEFDMKTCEDIMTPNPICCLPIDNVKKVAEIMLRENLGPIRVIDDD